MAGGMGAFERAKDFKGTVRRLGRVLRPYGWVLTFIVLLTILSTGFSALAPKVLALSTNEIARGSLAVLKGTGQGISMPADWPDSASFDGCVSSFGSGGLRGAVPARRRQPESDV